MSKKPIVLVPLAVALASLGTMANATTVPESSSDRVTSSAATGATSLKAEPNAFYQIGHDLMGMLITEKSDGTLVAGHTSHSSHASHSSHSSHSSSRY